MCRVQPLLVVSVVFLIMNVVIFVVVCMRLVSGVATAAVRLGVSGVATAMCDIIHTTVG